ncbi:hypothetical protein [Methylobacterium sp. WL7]|uniref:hypothetical protein n=1 Tax=Methylobacterium sp. WL7 TaxID=2603900 RepID=UPI0011C80B5D|nr:hypothetical protein [Methylobacterium sp. WL7]TXN46570.1 hypothetical protein FV233_07580 [Methylobacterium sp. WL7]
MSHLLIPPAIAMAAAGVGFGFGFWPEKPASPPPRMPAIAMMAVPVIWPTAVSEPDWAGMTARDGGERREVRVVLRSPYQAR